LLYELLQITIKLEDYREELFKEYLELPIEKNTNLKKEVAKKAVKSA
jgi:hypothetical protein